MKSLAEDGLFENVSKETLDIVTQFNQEKKNTFLIPTKFISSECGQVGFLLNEYFNTNRTRADRISYRTFFANSRFEAIQGAVKIARHKSVSMKKKSNGTILLCDPSLEFSNFVDPLNRGHAEALIPGIRIIPDPDELGRRIAQTPDPAAVVVCPSREMSASDMSELFSQCKKHRIITILEQSDLDVRSEKSLIHEMSLLPDIIVTGESLTNYEIPFGAFSMSKTVHQPWASMVGCFMHSSTYGGNNLSMTRVRDMLLRDAPCLRSDQGIQKKCDKIAEDNADRLNAFARYVNPGLVKLYALTGLDTHAVGGHGSKLRIRTEDHREKEIFDCVSASGAAVRGHTPQDIVPEVIQKHDPGEDYWKRLCDRLSDVSGLPHVFPAVSGASAVDIGMTLAMLANADKTKIVTFKENYAGKTLLSLVGTADKALQEPFRPLYHDVTYIDPFAANAKKDLESVLTSGTVALVWFEVVQGGCEEEIPRDLIDMVNQHKDKYGYMVGTDEIFNGFFRIGSLFSFQGKVRSPDIVTLAKPLSGGTFPFAATLVSSRLYDKAIQNQPDAVRYFEKLYQNQIGSHIAWHSVEKILSPEFERNVLKVSKILDKGLNEIARNSSLVKDISGRGHSYRLCYDDKHPLLCLPGGYWFFTLYACRLCLRKADVFLFFDECIPALTFTEEDAESVLTNLRAVFAENGSSTWLKFSFFMFRASFFFIADSLKSMIRRK